MTAHEDYDAGENGGAMTDGDYYETIARGEHEGTALAQAAYEARMNARGARLGNGYGIGMFNPPWHGLDEGSRDDEEAGAQAAIDAATEGSLRACGYTLADVGRFMEAEAAAAAAQPGCRASQSGNCLQLTHGFAACPDGECGDAAAAQGGDLRDLAAEVIRAWAERVQYDETERDRKRLEGWRARLAAAAQPAPEKPKVLGHPDDAAEEWLAEEFEPDDSTVGVGYEREHMINAFHAGSDWARGQIAKFGKDENGRWITLEQPAPAAAQPASGLRAALVETLADWRDDAKYHPNDTRDEITEHYAVTQCANRLADILRDYPEQPAAAAAPGPPATALEET